MLRSCHFIIWIIFTCPLVIGNEGIPDRVSWKSLRDENVVKQQQDYSCGGASIATILRYHYGLDVDEKATLLKIPDLDNDMSASFLELREGVRSFGYKARGVELGFTTLQKLTIPAIVHLGYESREHFSVIRGINPVSGLVWLADPSWGNRYLTRRQFLEMWLPDGRAKGRLLLVLPPEQAVSADASFFKAPQDKLGLARDLIKHTNTQVTRRWAR